MGAKVNKNQKICKSFCFFSVKRTPKKAKNSEIEHLF